MTIDAKFSIERGSFHLDVDLSLDPSGVTGLFGRSGSGKSTLLRALAGLDRHDHGFLSVNGDIWQNDQKFLPAHERSVGFVFQDAALFPHLSVKENVEYGFRRSASNSRTITVMKAAGMLGLEPILDRNPSSLSGGERQRVAVARALAVNPRLLLLDEPLASLDNTGKLEIIPYLSSLRAELGIPLIYVSHNLDEIARLADDVVLIENGRITAHEKTNEILTRLDLPVARAGDAESIMVARVKEIDATYGLAVLELEKATIMVPDINLAIGETVRVRISASDVSITLERQTGTSIQNIIPGTVDEIVEAGDTQVIVRLICGSVPLLSRITRKSSAELALKPGNKVYAQVKSVVLLH